MDDWSVSLFVDLVGRGVVLIVGSLLLLLQIELFRNTAGTPSLFESASRVSILVAAEKNFFVETVTSNEFAVG